MACGLPANIASYATLLHLLAKECSYKEGELIGYLVDTHIYENHINGLKCQIAKNPFHSPNIITSNFTSVFDWSWKDSKIHNYQSHDKIKFEVAV